MKKLKIVCIGTGYFSHFHYEAWGRIPEVEVSAICSLDDASAKAIQKKFNIKKLYSDYTEALAQERPDLVDIITPPATHAKICHEAANLGINIICQKPVCPTFADSKNLIEEISKKVRFIIHENWRFQPWHREIKEIIGAGTLGKLFNLNFNSRMGDGWGNDAYLARQPYFRDYERLLIYETGVHFIDTFRYHAGEVVSAYAKLKKLNPVINGEDCALMLLDFESGATALWNANRYNENNYTKDRFTFGEYVIEGEKGTLRLYADGKITVQLLGKAEKEHHYNFTETGFAGDCVYRFQQHAIDALVSNKPAETEATAYLKTLQVQEMVYQSATQQNVVKVNT
ncbi:MAG: Gfo/Idh/MocA family oxidoreductase [Leeuwenhoekiella sp.]